MHHLGLDDYEYNLTSQHPQQPHQQQQHPQQLSRYRWRRTSGRGPVIAMHVRHGDKYTESEPLAFKEYMKAVQQRFPEARRIFLMTDDVHTRFEAFINAEYHSRYEFLYLDIDTLLFDSHNIHNNNHYNNNYNTYDDATTTKYRGPLYRTYSESERLRALLCEIWIASECDGLVATMSSNLGRLIWELMYAKRPHARLVSLQSDWYSTP